MTQMIALIFLLTFAGLMVFIGLISAKQVKTLDGFVLGGRNVGAWMSAFAFGTSYFSAVIFVGYAGKNGWDVGFASMWIGIGNAFIGCLLAWKLLAKPVRRMTHNLNARTMPEFFGLRYKSNPMKLFAALIIFIFLVPYAASVYKGLGIFFGAIFPGAGNVIPGMSSSILCMLIVAILTGIYLVLGGYVAVALTDFIQGIIMIGGVIVLMVAVTMHPNVGGLPNAVKALSEMVGTDGKSLGLTNPIGGANWNMLMTNILLTSVGTFGLPQMVHKFYAIKDEDSIKRGAVISTFFALLIGAGAYYIGSLSRLMLGNTLPEGGYDYVIPSMLMSAFSGSFWGSILLSVILLLLLSASMSTLSSVVLSSSTAVTVDFFQIIRPKISPKFQMKLTRIMCFVFVALSFMFATFNFAIIVSIMSYSWGVVSGCFIGPFLWGLLSRRTNKAGAWAGMLGGFITILGMTIYHTLAALPASPSFYEAFKTASKSSPSFGVCAMAVSFVIVPLVSYLTKPMDKKHLDTAFGVEKA